jgi:hypothetical protein
MTINLHILAIDNTLNTDFYIIDMFEQLNYFETIQIANVYQIRINRTIY